MNQKSLDMKRSASFMVTLAKALKTVNKESVTPEELIAMAKMINQKAQLS